MEYTRMEKFLGRAGETEIDRYRNERQKGKKREMLWFPKEILLSL